MICRRSPVRAGLIHHCFSCALKDQDTHVILKCTHNNICPCCTVGCTVEKFVRGLCLEGKAQGHTSPVAARASKRYASSGPKPVHRSPVRLLAKRTPSPTITLYYGTPHGILEAVFTFRLPTVVVPGSRGYNTILAQLETHTAYRLSR